jgi:hypothetical protein
LRFEHFVNDEGTTIVCAKLNGTGRTKILKICRNGDVETFEGGRFVKLDDEMAILVMAEIRRAKLNGVPEYRTHNGG